VKLLEQILLEKREEDTDKDIMYKLHQKIYFNSQLILSVSQGHEADEYFKA